MPELILVVLQRPDTAISLLNAAERLSVLADGAAITALATPEGEVSPDSLRAPFEDWRTQPRAAATAARLVTIDASASEELEERGARADLLVIARPDESYGRLQRRVFRSALVKTERPVLVVPPNMPVATVFGSRVAIAWRDDPRTVKAVLPAIRYLRRAERVFLLSGIREGRAIPLVPEVLKDHDVPVEMHVLPIARGIFGETLLSKAHELEADLLLMGAYAHGKLHDLVFGGVTRFMLGNADIPVLMRY